jgi:hypothetical protein
MLDAQGGKRNVDLSPMFVFNFFASRCQDRLHWAICLDPESSNFRSWLQKYPAILSHCTPINFPVSSCFSVQIFLTLLIITKFTIGMAK